MLLREGMSKRVSAQNDTSDEILNNNSGTSRLSGWYLKAIDQVSSLTLTDFVKKRLSV